MKAGDATIAFDSKTRRKLHDDLQDQGETCCPNCVARLTKLAGIKAKIGYRRRSGTYGGKSSIVVDNTLERQFNVTAPDTAWVTDITYIKTTEGFAYLAVVIDLYSRRVLGKPRSEASSVGRCKAVRLPSLFCGLCLWRCGAGSPEGSF